MVRLERSVWRMTGVTRRDDEARREEPMLAIAMALNIILI